VAQIVRKHITVTPFDIKILESVLEMHARELACALAERKKDTQEKSRQTDVSTLARIVANGAMEHPEIHGDRFSQSSAPRSHLNNRSQSSTVSIEPISQIARRGR